MKKAAILTAFGLILAGSLALAATPKGTSCTKVEGTINAIDPATMQIVVDQTVVQVTPDTVIKKNGRVIAFSDLAVGQQVAACGLPDGDVLVAKRITVKYCGL